MNSSTATDVRCVTTWREPAATALIGCRVLLPAGSVGQTANLKKTYGCNGRLAIAAGRANGTSPILKPWTPTPQGKGYLELQRLKANALVSPPIVAVFGRFNEKEVE